MELIYLANTRLPTEKARGLQIMKSCEAFQAVGFDITLVVPKDRNPIKTDPFIYYGIKTHCHIKKIYNGAALFRILPDRLAFYARSLIFAKLAVLLFFFKRRKVMFYSRDYAVLAALALFGFRFIAEIHDYRSKHSRHWINYALKKAEKIIVNSAGTRTALLEHYSILEQKLLIVPNGVDLDFFNVDLAREMARTKLNLPLAVPLVGYIGSLEMLGQEKGIRELINANIIVAQTHNDALLYIIGGPNNTIEKYKAIAGQNSRIIFTGQVDYSRIPLYLKALDMVVVPLPAGTLLARTSSPIKIFESMAAGKVIIASDVPAARQYLNQNNALFFESGNVADLAKKITFAIGHPEMVKQLSAQALKDVQQYSWLNRAQSIKSFLS